MQDLRVNPKAPSAMDFYGRKVSSTNANQNEQAQKIVKDSDTKGFADIRVDQQQVNEAGQRVGVCRPDIQCTNLVTGQREYFELDTSKSLQGDGT